MAVSKPARHIPLGLLAREAVTLTHPVNELGWVLDVGQVARGQPVPLRLNGLQVIRDDERRADVLQVSTVEHRAAPCEMWPGQCRALEGECRSPAGASWKGTHMI